MNLIQTTGTTNGEGTPTLPLGREQLRVTGRTLSDGAELIREDRDR
jgi:hypothetical protein